MKNLYRTPQQLHTILFRRGNQMNKRKISGKQLLSDIKSGMSDAQLMAKHDLTSKALASAFSKLIEAGLLNAASLRERGLVKTDPKPGTFEGHVDDSKPAVSDGQRPTELLQAIAYDVKSGLHDSDIMRRHELSPGKLKEIKDELVRLGYLSAVHVLAAEAKKTKLCPFCSQEIQESAAKCVHCGQWLQAGAAGVRMGPPQPEVGAHDGSFPAAPEEHEVDCPWEDRGSYGTLNAFFQTATKCLLTPTAFFSRLPRQGGFLNPVLFGVMSIVVSFVLAYIWYSLLGRGGAGLIGLVIGLIFVVLGAFIIIPIALLVWSGILHLCLLMVGGANAGYQGTFRVVSYSSVTSLFNAIPVVGTVASLWGIVLTVIGLREIHNTSTGKSVAALLIPLGVVIILGLGVGLKALRSEGISRSTSLLSRSTQSQTLTNDVCAALEDYIAKVEAAKGQDPSVAQPRVQLALAELEGVLYGFKGKGNVGRVRQFARSFGGSMIAQMHLQRASGAAADLSKLDDALQTERDALLGMCGK